MRTVLLSSLSLWGVVVSIGMLGGCATESQRALPTATLAPQTTQQNGPRQTLVVGKFDNRSNYLRGVFSDAADPLGGQAKTILKTHLQQSARFNVVDRENMKELADEAQFAGTEQTVRGARYLVTGDITEYGRKETGDRQLFGVLGSGKQQVAYSKVALNIVDVKTSQIVFSVQGAGEYQLSNREVLGFGGTAGYDSTLNGKVLNLAIMQAVQRLIEAVDTHRWQPDS